MTLNGQFGAWDGGIKSFFTRPSNAFHGYFNGNEEYESTCFFIQIRMTRTLVG